EKRLREVAVEVGAPLSTVHNRYCSAFELVTGRPYDPNLWAVLFGPLKFPLSRLAGWRKPKGPRQVGDGNSVVVSAFCPSGDNAGPGTAAPGPSCDETAYQSLLLDLRSLFDLGRSDEAIAGELSIPVEVVAEVRARGLDGL